MDLSEATQRELFLEVLNRYRISYMLDIKEPYGHGDGYIVIYDRYGAQLGEMNYEGYNLLYNLTNLNNMLRKELL